MNNQVEIYKVVKDYAVTCDRNYIPITVCEPPERIHGDDDVVIHSNVDITNCKIHRIHNVFNGSHSEKLIAFHPDFSELLINEVIDYESKEVVERSQKRARDATKQVIKTLNEMGLAKKKVNNAGFVERLKYFLTGKFNW